jgi:hypothetical protein
MTMERLSWPEVTTLVGTSVIWPTSGSHMSLDFEVKATQSYDEHITEQRTNYLHYAHHTCIHRMSYF